MRTVESPPETGRVPPVATMPTLQGAFEAPQGPLFEAIGRHKRLIAVFAVLGALAGIALGYVRPATYEASATLQVGQVNPNSAGFASYTQSASSLATAFSRAIAATPVLMQVEKRLQIPPERAVARLSSEPIPLSPAFRVIAKGPSAEKAKQLANVAAAAVIAYENRSNSANPQAAALLSSYRRASLALNKANAAVTAANAGGSSEDVLAAEAAQSAATIRLKAIGATYIATVGSQPPREGFVSLLAGATSASGNRAAKMQLYGFLGLLLGLAGGCAAAYLSERRRRAAPTSEPSLKPQPR
ncbi:MAG: Wzz/FepE/Etk N-terminal domain-containing protein [Solirubrobacterales bacterium]